MLRLGIDPEKLYRATFICHDGLCCCNMALTSLRLFRKNLGNLRDVFGQMVYRPPPPGKKFPLRLWKFQTGIFVEWKAPNHFFTFFDPCYVYLYCM